MDAPPAVHAAHAKLLNELNEYAGQFLEHVLQRMQDADIEPNVDDFGAGSDSFYSMILSCISDAPHTLCLG
jgi:hypothetical protein